MRPDGMTSGSFSNGAATPAAPSPIPSTPIDPDAAERNAAGQSKFVIVYHRQPYDESIENGQIVRRENKSPNGIVPTLKSFFGRVQSGSWIAWKETDTPETPGFEPVIEIDDAYGNYRVSRLPLTPEQVSSFYHVTSKEALWPVLHSFRDRYNYDPVDWPTFREVNWLFAEAAAAEAADDATIWVHDYNLWLVPGYLRTLKPNATIAFFHHTPFPAPDIFNMLPWREEIVRSLLDCDVVGFHLPRYSRNFVAVAQSLTEVDAVEAAPTDPALINPGSALSEIRAPHALSVEGRTVRLTSHPVGVDVSFIEETARSQETAALEAQIHSELDGKRLILAVSRTDYTKGGVESLLTFERLLERRPELIGEVRLMFVSVRANMNMAVYRQVQMEIEAITGRINARFARVGWQPVHLLSNPIPFRELIAFHRRADVCWITPLADGLNLVAKEFVASQDERGSGVLALSEFAGVAVEYEDALLCNPFSTRSLDSAMDQALDMPLEERRARMARLRAATAKNSIGAWADAMQRSFDAA